MQNLLGLKTKTFSWDIVLSSSSIAGIQAAVNAGIAITALPLSSVLKEMRILDHKDGFPVLGDTDLGIYGSTTLDEPHIRSLVTFLKEKVK